MKTEAEKWSLDENCIDVIDSNGTIVATARYGHGHTIAAAPDLLAACEAAMANHTNAAALMIAAINKAKGES